MVGTAKRGLEVLVGAEPRKMNFNRKEPASGWKRDTSMEPAWRQDSGVGD